MSIYPAIGSLKRWAGVTIRHEFQFDTGDILRIDTANMRARAARLFPPKTFPELCFPPCNKSLKRLSRQIVFPDNDHRIARQHCNQLEISEQVESERYIAPFDDMSAEIAKTDPIAVRCRAHSTRHTDRAASASDVFDEDGFLKVSLVRSARYMP